MQPIGTIFDKFKRIVRDLAQKLDKKIELHIEGSDIELDRMLLEALSDPLTHLIRNSVGHGIEIPEERSAEGKSMTGNVYLRAYHESGQILIEVEDDGRGIDSARVKEKAIEKGLISEEDTDKLRQDEIIRFIFEPGFSTKDEAGDLSGRGVGMDVVKRSLEKIGCTLDATSIPGKGMMVSASIPLTQAIVNSSIISGLIIRLGGFKLALPQLAVSELIKVTQEDQKKLIERIKGEDVFKLRGKLIPLVHLEDILDIPRYINASGNKGRDERERLSDRRQSEEELPEEIKLRRTGKERRRSNLIFIVLQYKHNYFGVLIDEVLGVEEIVVKRLPFSIKHRKVFAGTTILGNGEVSLILDINGIVEKGGMDFAKQYDRTGAIFDHKKSIIEKEQVVIFCNAESEFFGIPLSLVSQIERVKTEDINKMGDKEFIRVHGESLPLLRLENQLDVTTPDLANKNCLTL